MQSLTNIQYRPERALELLRLGTGQPNAVFRDGQEGAIRFVVEGRGRLLVVQKTGWGKSFVYFIATRLLREAGGGPALLVSPLLALMRNQISGAERMGVHAATINSDNQTEWGEVINALDADAVDILLISPERFANEEFRAGPLAEIAGRVSLFVVDEAHCISDWGHDFRPDYRRIERIVRTLPPNLRLLATTATANNRVMNDLNDVLGPNLEIVRGDLSRPSLLLQTIRMPVQAERLAWLAQTIPTIPGSGIVYTLTIRDAEQVAEWLRSCDINAEAYTGQSGDRRPELEQALLTNSVKVLVATTALGMGFDKPDLAFVIHYQAPGSVVAYYQQVGRAGRALDAAYCVLLSGTEETEINEFFINSAFPTPDEAGMVLQALESAPEGLSIHELAAGVNLSYARIQKTLDLISLESPSPIAKVGTRWQLTTVDLSDEFWARARRLSSRRRFEQFEMQEYVTRESGHMEYLIEALDGDPTTARVPDVATLPTIPDRSFVNEAIAFLRRSDVPFEPRRTWPPGGMPVYRVKGRIPENRRAQPGRGLCIWGDAGWGNLVNLGKFQDQFFDDDLLEACVSMFERWRTEPSPTWVTCVPSLRHPDLVPDFAERLASRLGLPFRTALVKKFSRPEQKTMKNSSQQARNLDGAIEVDAGQVLSEPVLLVDDIVDSGWTMTVCSWLLREHGAEDVLPLALAVLGRRG
ncbi:MAG: RecQ family ATP-dependent DNA helicase [Nitrolancea sp.]